MPIKNLTTNVLPQFPSLGILRKGAKRTEEDMAKKRPGQDLEFFRFVNEQRPRLEKDFATCYGLEPARIPFYFMYDHIPQVWDSWMKEYVAGGLIHKCDGETMVLWRDEKTGKYSHEPRPCPYFTGEKKRTKDNPGCKETGELKILLPKLLELGHVGDVTVLTSSKWDHMSIQACLNEIYADRRAHGLGLKGIEFIMERVKRKISTPRADGKRVRQIKSLIIIYPAEEWVKFQIESAKRAQFQLDAPALHGLPAGESTEANGDNGAGEDEEVFGDDYAPGEFTEGEYVDESAEGFGDDEPEDEEPEAPPAPVLPTTFRDLNEAVKWGADYPGAFACLDHAKNAYNELKLQLQPKSSAAMFKAWIALVLHEAEVHAHEPAQEPML